MRLGVLDVGSNTVHLLVVDAQPGGRPLPAFSDKTQLHLAEQLTPDGSLSDSAIVDLIKALARSHEVAEDRGCEAVLAFATSAIREAPNGEKVLTAIRAATGYTLRVLSGADEARLTFLAARRWFGWSSGRLLVLDIGGGSLELATGVDEEPDVATSLPLGAGRITRDLLPGDPPSLEVIAKARRVIRAQVAAQVRQFTVAPAPDRVVGTSKTLRSLARIAGTGGSSGPMTLSRTGITAWLPELAVMTTAERAALPGVTAQRAGQLLAGALVADAALDLLGVAQLEICPWALREGMILRWLDAYRAAEEI